MIYQWYVNGISMVLICFVFALSMVHDRGPGGSEVTHWPGPGGGEPGELRSWKC